MPPNSPFASKVISKFVIAMGRRGGGPIALRASIRLFHRTRLRRVHRIAPDLCTAQRHVIVRALRLPVERIIEFGQHVQVETCDSVSKAFLVADL